LCKSPGFDRHLARSDYQRKDDYMETQRLERFLASAIYLLTAVSAGRMFSIGLANGIASGYHYPIQQKLLIGAALTGAAALTLSAILVHFRPSAAYGIASVSALLLWLAYWPLIGMIALIIAKHREMLLSGDGPIDVIFSVSLLSVTTIISLLRSLKLARS
jgi:hypothetical protein